MRRPDAVTRPGPGAVAAAVPFCLMALVVVTDVLAGPQIGLLPLLSLGPALAPVSLGPARTALTGGLAIVLSLLLAVYDGIGLTVHSAVAVTTIIGATAAGISPTPRAGAGNGNWSMSGRSRTSRSGCCCARCRGGWARSG